MAQSPRTEHLVGVRRVVVKVGSAVLTNRDGLDPTVIQHLAQELAALHGRGLDVVLVTSAAVAAGRSCMRTRGQNGSTDLSDLPGRQAASAIGQSRLMHEYDQALERLGIITAQVLLTRSGLKQRERFLNARNTLDRLLKWRVIPIINENDTVSVAELVFGDNDTLSAVVAGLVGADLCLNLTSADGVFDKNPDTNPDAKPMRLIDDIATLDIPAMCDGKTAVGSGGMYSKLLAARRAAQIGSPTLILSGKGDFSLAAALDGAEVGTFILPGDRHISSKKFWLAYHDDPAGAVFVDAGAARALADRGKSLLPAGITRVEGDFDQNALIAIKLEDGTTLGVGLTNFSSLDLERIKGEKTSEIETILGRASCEEAVHRDKMLLDPALKEQ
ncbi:MAG: glutamate 5-kinase [Proteobacteria bacterium]|nr:glutamate 5-kinase [Pseudomonadota bacterium]